MQEARDKLIEALVGLNGKLVWSTLRVPYGFQHRLDGGTFHISSQNLYDYCCNNCRVEHPALQRHISVIFTAS